MVGLVGWLVACQAPAPADGSAPDGPPPPDSGTAPTLDTGDTGDGPTTPIPTGDTGEPLLCESPFGYPLTYTSTSAIWTEEDFDFDLAGHLITQSGSDLLGIARDGSSTVVAPNVGLDIAGIRSLPDGNVIVAQQDTGSVRLVNMSTGGSVSAVGGLDFPNGLEVERGGQAYVSEYSANGAVRSFDPYTGENEVVVSIPFPNGLALSPDEQTLYIATSEALFSGTGRVAAIDRDASGVWDPATLREVYQADDLLDALAVDLCGNLYVTTYRTGRVIRVAPDGTTEQLVDLPNVGIEGYCAARFGPGIDTWDRTTLFVSNRYEVYAIEVGLEGRHVLAP